VNPGDWAENEARREESLRRAHERHGTEPSERARTVVAAIVGIAFLAVIVYAILAWLGVFAVPGVTA
jgi:hypothetical protein